MRERQVCFVVVIWVVPICNDNTMIAKCLWTQASDRQTDRQTETDGEQLLPWQGGKTHSKQQQQQHTKGERRETGRGGRGRRQLYHLNSKPSNSHRVLSFKSSVQYPIPLLLPPFTVLPFCLCPPHPTPPLFSHYVFISTKASDLPPQMPFFINKHRSSFILLYKKKRKGRLLNWYVPFCCLFSHSLFPFRRLFLCFSLIICGLTEGN